MYLEPRDELLQFAHLVALLAAKHRQGQLADILATGLAGHPANAAHDEPGVEQFAEPARCFAEEFKFLRQVNVEPTKEYRRPLGLVGLVKRERQVKRNHQRVVPRPPKLGHQGVVAKTIPAIHPPRAGC